MSVTHDSPDYNAQEDTSPASFASKVRTLRRMLYDEAPLDVPDAVASTFVGDNATLSSSSSSSSPSTAMPRTGFVLAVAQADLAAIAEDLGVQNVVSTDDPRVTVRLRSLLDGISTTLQGHALPLLAQETTTTDNGTNITNMVALCQHADNLISGLKGSSRPKSSQSNCALM